MTTHSDGLGLIYTIWMSDNSCTSIDPEDAPLVDRAMKLLTDSARTRGTWLSLRAPGGSEFSVLASVITSALTTTAEQRTEAMARDKALEEERAENRRLAGYIESEQ